MHCLEITFPDAREREREAKALRTPLARGCGLRTAAGAAALLWRAQYASPPSPLPSSLCRSPRRVAYYRRCTRLRLWGVDGGWALCST
eukprot:scaffold2973_cov114-Isochrysis_galbana.AAC.1